MRACRLVRSACPPNVVDDLLRAPRIEDGDEPGADRPAPAVAQGLCLKRLEIAIGPVEPGEKGSRGEREKGRLGESDDPYAGVAGRRLPIRNRFALSDSGEQRALENA